MTNFSNTDRAQVLLQALPYIKQHAGKVVVVKYGGNAMVNEEIKLQVMKDIVLLWRIGIKVVLVHGGGPEISNMMTKLGKEVEFIDGVRKTDKEAMNIVQMVLAGSVNKTLVGMLETCGGHAMGICGLDGSLIKAEQQSESLGYVGEITKINVEPVVDLLALDYIPVIATIGCDSAGNTYNINGDTAAAAIAGALHAERLIMMTDVNGILTNKENPESIIKETTISDVKELLNNGTISGGMIPKVQCCIDALDKGVENVVIINGQEPHAVIMELLSDEGAGTMVTK